VPADYTAELEEWVSRTCEQIQQVRRLGAANHPHTMPGKHRAYRQRFNCDQVHWSKTAKAISALLNPRAPNHDGLRTTAPIALR